MYDTGITNTGTTQSGPPGELRPRTPRGAPQQLGRFAVRGVLGSGAMGIVYEAVDDELDRRVALKLVHPELSSESRQRRLLREAQALARLAHPNVLAVYEVGSVDGALFIAMEHVDGQNLEEWLGERPREWTELVRVFAQAGAGLAAAHAVGLIHRDFKPANVLIGRDGRVRVADFGLARTLPELTQDESTNAGESASRSRTVGRAGTPAYMAPEVLAGGPADALSDQFSFCVALHEALYGHRPLVNTDAPRPPALRRPEDKRGVPAWLHALLARGLGPRAQRWSDLDALLRALDPARRRRRRRFVLAGIGLGGLVATTAVAWPGASEPACSAEAASIASWTEEARTVLGTRLALAEVPAALVLTRLDSYASRWQRASLDNCEATHVHGHQSEVLLDARSRCLDGRRSHFEALVTVLSQDHAQASERALGALDALPPIERCADLDYVSARLPLPDDPAVAAEVRRLEERQSTLTALRNTGQYQRTQAELDALGPALEATGHAPLQASYGLLRGKLLDDLGEAEAAAAALEQTYLLAESCGAFELSQDASIYLVYLHGYRREALDEAERWRALAEAKIRYNGDPLAPVVLDINWGESLEAAGEFERALVVYTRARELHRSHGAPSALRSAELSNDMGDVLGKLTRYEEGEATLLEALELWRAELGDDHPSTARAYNSLAVLYFRTQRHADAAEAFEAALRIWTRTKGPESDDVAAMHSNLGVVYRRLGEQGQARGHLERALEIREHAGPEALSGVAATLGNLGNLELDEDNFDEALAHFERALSIHTELYGPDDDRLAGSLKGVAAAHVRRGSPALALPPLERLVAIRERVLEPGHPFLLSSRNVLSAALLELGRVAGARAVLDRNLAQLDERPVEEAARCRMATAEARVLWAEGAHERAHAQLERGRDDCERNAPQYRQVFEDIEAWRSEHALKAPATRSRRER